MVFVLSKSYSKTGKLRAVLENHPAALKLWVNKKDILKAALNFFASVSCFKTRNEVWFGRSAKFVYDNISHAYKIGKVHLINI